jgi:hypothetical protein
MPIEPWLRFKVKNASKVCPFCITDLKYNSVTGVATELYFISFASKKLKCLAFKPNSGYGENSLDYIEAYYTFALHWKPKVQSYPFANN